MGSEWQLLQNMLIVLRSLFTISCFYVSLQRVR